MWSHVVTSLCNVRGHTNISALYLNYLASARRNSSVSAKFEFQDLAGGGEGGSSAFEPAEVRERTASGSRASTLLDVVLESPTVSGYRGGARGRGFTVLHLVDLCQIIYGRCESPHFLHAEWNAWAHWKRDRAHEILACTAQLRDRGRLFVGSIQPILFRGYICHSKQYVPQETGSQDAHEHIHAFIIRTEVFSDSKQCALAEIRRLYSNFTLKRLVDVGVKGTKPRA
ncbi:hypothetical protein BOTBODRAFT_416223 [Botryobasidium botryosum FD-172 SS1]|uniref:Uncharacterized protein n=1 Tax=Botryobasidium botryosum (strain FD-172 SS1) TaxID=930990 RepID=A0A067MLJ2_BOTB1|nr:hypothetical protein BOTBODRAFT_416223 [Botryobasidium botryosum FD-172 SS1]